MATLGGKEKLNPAALTPTEAARMLSVASGRKITVAMVREAIAAGAPVLSDERLNLVQLMAWLEGELANR